MFSKLLHDITTGSDNQTHEIIRVFMVVVIGILLFAFSIGSFMEVRHAVLTGQWDSQSYYQAIGTFIITVGGFIIAGAGAIKLKTNSDSAIPGTSTSTSTITKTTSSAAAPDPIAAP